MLRDLVRTMFRKRHPKPGARPGTLVIPDDALPPKIRVMHFSEETIDEADVTEVESLNAAFDESTVTWVDIQGTGDEELVRRVGEVFSMHRLTVEDLVNVPQRPKCEFHESQIVFIARQVRVVDGALVIEQVGLVLGPTYVVTMQERYGDVLDGVRKRIRGGGFKKRKADYLAYAILDAMVDGYYPALEAIGDFLVSLEDSVIDSPSPELLRDLHRTRNQLINLRRAIFPQREAFQSLVRESTELLSDDTRFHLRDVYDHCVQTLEVTEMYREMTGGLVSTYLSAVANRTNEVMKVLTVMASIFIPLTFLAGIYGMNFEHMPELKVWWTYPLVWGLMLGLAGGMLWFFRKKGWIGTGTRNEGDGRD